MNRGWPDRMEREVFKMFKVNVFRNADVGWELYGEESHGILYNKTQGFLSLSLPPPPLPLPKVVMRSE